MYAIFAWCYFDSSYFGYASHLDYDWLDAGISDASAIIKITSTDNHPTCKIILAISHRFEERLFGRMPLGTSL